MLKHLELKHKERSVNVSHNHRRQLLTRAKNDRPHFIDEDTTGLEVSYPQITVVNGKAKLKPNFLPPNGTPSLGTILPAQNPM